MHSTIPERAQMIPTTILILGVVLYGITISGAISKPMKTVIYSVFLVLFLFKGSDVIQDNFAMVREVKEYSQKWDLRDQTLRENNELASGIHVPWEQWEAKIDCVNDYYDYVRTTQE
ncbi:MAG: hypothetical protein JEZ06_12805 [Anaerolineaceae bacterium]|nr:hypothetical protein [Anaerolineaceae bacterium]